MNYLFVSSHVDDSELSCGATIAKLKEQGHNIDVITLSCIYEGFDLSDEWSNTMEVFGVRYLFKQNFKTRYFYEQCDAILQYLFKFENKYDFIFAPSAKDVHSDHATVGKCCERVFKTSNLITYTGDWNTRSKETNYFVAVEKSHVEQKIKALSCYESQKNRPYMHPDYIWSNALNTGVMCGAKYAESFQSINIIV